MICTLRQMIKSGRIRWAGYVARMGEKRNTYRLFIGGKAGGKETNRKTKT
jgi:hypothetical protein